MTFHIDKHLDVAQLEKLAERIQKKSPVAVKVQPLAMRELTVGCPVKNIPAFLAFLKDDEECQFHQLIDLCGVDYLAQKGVFEVVYHLLSVQFNLRIRVKAEVKEGQTVPTSTGVFPAANWYEREAFDLFGIPFAGHPDLRRILTDYGFDGHPLRKDFPLEGHLEVFYDEARGRVAYKPVDLPQATRTFTASSPWEGMTGNLERAETPSVFKPEEFN